MKPIALSAGLVAGVLVNLPTGLGAESSVAPAVSWRQCLGQPPAWYATAEAARVADQVLLYQRACGGWGKNVDMAAPLTESERAALERQRGERESSTIDNGATYTQMAFLARIYAATQEPRFREGFLKGFEFLLAAQYANGGWPQFPLGRGYSRHITFNDDAMIGVMRLLRAVAQGEEPYEWVVPADRRRAADAVARGVACVLDCQVVAQGRRTAWCAQHDERTLAPAAARSYELASLSGSESVGIVRFLMGLEAPTPEVKRAVESAVAWFEQAKLTGIRQVRQPDATLPRGYDKVIVADPTAEPLWARFYDLETGRPFFCGRDGVKRQRLANIEYERRNGYSWYTDAPARLLAVDYPAWRTRHQSGAAPRQAP